MAGLGMALAICASPAGTVDHRIGHDEIEAPFAEKAQGIRHSQVCGNRIGLGRGVRQADGRAEECDS
jgi:hypothetical protein